MIFLVNDGDVDSNIVSRDIDFTAVNDAPTLANIEAVPASYTEGGSAVDITANLSLADPDDTNIESAVVSISNNFAAGEDELIFTCLLYTSPSPQDQRGSRMPSSA